MGASNRSAQWSPQTAEHQSAGPADGASSDAYFRTSASWAHLGKLERERPAEFLPWRPSGKTARASFPKRAEAGCPPLGPDDGIETNVVPASMSRPAFVSQFASRLFLFRWRKGAVRVACEGPSFLTSSLRASTALPPSEREVREKDRGRRSSTERAPFTFFGALFGDFGSKAAASLNFQFSRTRWRRQTRLDPVPPRSGAIGSPLH